MSQYTRMEVLRSPGNIAYLLLENQLYQLGRGSAYIPGFRFIVVSNQHQSCSVSVWARNLKGQLETLKKNSCPDAHTYSSVCIDGVAPSEMLISDYVTVIDESEKSIRVIIRAMGDVVYEGAINIDTLLLHLNLLLNPLFDSRER